VKTARKTAKKTSQSFTGWASVRNVLEKGDPRRIFAGKFSSERSRVIRTAKNVPQRRQSVKRRKRVLMARKQRVIRAFVSTAKLLAFAGILAILVLDVRDYLYSSPRFSITHVAVTGNTHVTAREVIDKTGIAEGDNIFRVRLLDSVRMIEEIPWVWRARIEKALPNEIHIEVDERRPIAYVVSGALFLVDEEGKIVAESNPSEKFDAPIITAKNFADLTPGATLNMEGITDALKIVKLLNKTDLMKTIRISEINIDEAPNIHLVAEQSGASIVLGSEDFEAKLWRLAKVAEAIGRDNRLAFADLQKVDMRFESIVPAQFEGK